MEIGHKTRALRTWRQTHKASASRRLQMSSGSQLRVGHRSKLSRRIEERCVALSSYVLYNDCLMQLQEKGDDTRGLCDDCRSILIIILSVSVISHVRGDRTARRSRERIVENFVDGRHISLFMPSIHPQTVAELCLSGVPTETCRQLCWYVLVDTLPK